MIFVRTIDYLIVKGTSEIDLESLVNAHLADGWEPQGGVAAYECVQDELQRRVFCQALVKHKKERW